MKTYLQFLTWRAHVQKTWTLEAEFAILFVMASPILVIPQILMIPLMRLSTPLNSHQHCMRHSTVLSRPRVRLQREKENSPKTYCGNSKKTQSCCEKTCLTLALRGFHDVFSFLAMKEKEKATRGGSLEDNKLANLLSSEGGGGGGGRGDDELEVLRAADSDQEQVIVSAVECASDKPKGPVPHPLGRDQSDSFGDLDEQTLSRTVAFEDEESSGENKAPSFFYHTRPRILDNDNLNCRSGGIGDKGGGKGSGSRKGKELHWAAEEEESADDLDSLKLVGVMQHGEAGGLCLQGPSSWFNGQSVAWD